MSITALRTEPKSKGHLFWTRSPEYGVYEYYKAGDSIYRAQVYYAGGTHAGSYMDTQTGYRSGGRFETQATPQHLAKLKESLKGIIVRNPNMRQRNPALDDHARTVLRLKHVLANKKKNGNRMSNPEIENTDLAEIMSAAFQNGVEVGQQLASSTDELSEFDEYEKVGVEENPNRPEPAEYRLHRDSIGLVWKARSPHNDDWNFSQHFASSVGLQNYLIEAYGVRFFRKVKAAHSDLFREQNGKKRNSIFLAPSVLQSMGQSGLGQLLTRANPNEPELTLVRGDGKGKYEIVGRKTGKVYASGISDVLKAYKKEGQILKTLYKKRNPETDAAALYEQFHGKPSEQITEYTYSEHEHETLAQLGELVSLTVVTTTGYEVKIGAPPADGNITDVIQLCSSEDGRQLYFIGGNQSIDIAALGFKPKDEKDLMLLGVLTMVEYQTEKGFHNFQLTDYYHQLGEESGVQPVLLYDPISQLMKVAGGQYQIKPEGIVN